MEDWGDDEDLDLEVLDAVEQQALAERAGQGATASAQCSTAAASGAVVPQPAQQREEGPARTPAELCRRCQLLRQAPPPPPQLTHDRCPGVYGRGCGGALRLVTYAEGAVFWVCSSHPDCVYREFAPPRKVAPELCLTLDRQRGAVEAAAMPGAEEAVQFCGGVAAVLRVAGVDLARMGAVQAAAAPASPPVAKPPPAPPDSSATALAEAAAEGEGRDAAAATTESEPPAASSGPAAAATAAAAAAAAAASILLLPVVFPLAHYERLSGQLLQFTRQHGVCLLAAAGTIPGPTLKAARGTLRTLPPADAVRQLYARMPPFLEAALLPFQREGVLFGLARSGRCLIADEMGVGKTVQAIALASCYQEEWPLLIIVPASLRLVWAEELEKWLPHLRPASIHVIEGKENRVSQGSLPLVTITSYEMMQRLTCDACKGRGGPHTSVCAGQRLPCKDPQNCIASQRWRVVIVDESHTLRTSNKAPDALHTEAVVCCLKLARRAILLTGTPSLSRPFDLFRQVDAVMPGLLGANRIAFAASYCNRREVPLPAFHGGGGGGNGERRTRLDVSGLSRGPELHDMLKAEVMLRRLKRDVLSQLPPKRRQVIRLPKPPAAEWPKLAPGRRRHADDSEGSASSAGEEDEEAEEGGGDGEEGDGGSGSGSKRPAKPMSSAHRTGLAKTSAVIDWLTTALGVRAGGGGGGGGKGGGRGLPQAAEDDDEDASAGGVVVANGSASASGGADAGPKFLVFAHHKTVMNRLAAALEGATGYAPVSYVRIDGGTDPEDRRVDVRRFHSDASVRVALLSVTAAGVGLDFSAASVVVFAELPDEVAHVRQAEDRAHRQGQCQPVNIYFLCAKGTTDDRRWQHLNRSLARVSAVHDGAAAAAEEAAAPGVAGAAAGGSGRCGGGDGKAAAAAVAAQAGLLVEGVHDAEEAGLTPAAAKAGMSAAAAAAAATAAASAAVAVEEEEAGALPASAGPAAAEEAATAAPAAAGVVAKGGSVSPAAIAQPEQAPSCSSGAAAGAEGEAAAQPAQQAEPPASLGGRRQPTRGRREASIGTRLAARAHQQDAAGQAAALPVMANTGSSCPVAPPPQPAEPAEVWFEVSANTSRVHLHAAPDGSAPLRLSLPLESLLTGDSPSLEELLQAVSLESHSNGQQQQKQQEEQEQQPSKPSQPQSEYPSQQQQTQQHQQGQRPAVIAGIGVLALDRQLSAAKLAAMLAEARDFAAEWRELRGLHHSRLHGRVLRAPLQEAVDEVDLAAAAAGRLGTSTSRFVDAAQRADLALPAGAEWRTVRVLFTRYGRETAYQQPFMPDGARLCINCARPVPGVPKAAQVADALLGGMTHLFCSGECEGRFGLKSNGSAYRRALFKLERGVCVTCRLDCHTLVKRMQAVDKGSRGWEEQRRRIVAVRAPRFLARGYKAHLDLLVRRAVEGNAWQADHILPVYKGGGLCDVDNLRTLCVACHADVTKQQTKQRAAGRRQEKAARAGTSSGDWGDVAAKEGKAGESREAEAEQPVVKRRPRRLQRIYVEDSDSDSWLPPEAAAAIAAATESAAATAAKAAAKKQVALTGKLQAAAAAAAGSAGAAVPAAAAAAAGPGGSGKAAPRRVPRTRVKRLLLESDDAELLPLPGPAADEQLQAVAAGAEQQPQEQQQQGARAAPARLHRLSRSSTADEAAERGPPDKQEGPAKGGVAAVAEAVGKDAPLPLTSGAANRRGATAGQKRPRVGASGAAASKAKPKKVGRRPLAGKKEYVDDTSDNSDEYV